MTSRPTFGCSAILQPLLLRLVALLLVFHWAAPSAQPLQLVLAADRSAPAFATGSFDLHQGTLPRPGARIQTLDGGASKMQQRVAPPSAGKLAILAAADPVASQPSRSGAFADPGVQRVALFAPVFDARGPPVR